MTPQKLKNSILQLAIQGKLVEQRPEEGTAEELYAEIQKEKAKLIKEGKIKKEKPLPEITDDEKPFDIPESWKWCRIGEIADSNIGLTYKPSDVVEKNGILVLRSSNIQNNKMAYDDNVFVSCVVPENSRIDKGDLLICARNGSRSLVGKCAIVDKDGCAFGAFMAKIKSPFVPYIKCFLDSPAYRSQLDGVKTETINQITQANLKKQIIPLPPLAEQHRIVAKIEELLPLIDRYEKAYTRLEDFNKRFPTDMQKSILQMAIEGKLVEQRPEEGTGEELYQQIQAEKAALIKAGKIKKEKPLPEITDDEKPFDIPESWKWVRLNEIISVLGDGIHGTPIFDENGSFYFINGNNLANGTIELKADTKRVDISEYKKYKKPLDNNTILISINGTIGNYAFYNGEPVILGKSACYFSVSRSVCKEYICKLLMTKHFYDYAVKEATQTTIKNVSLQAMRMLPIPLPPLAEQKRIVAKLEELLPLCERLK